MLKLIFIVLYSIVVSAEKSVISVDLIQELILKAKPGEEIIIPEGHYKGNLVINKSVKLLGNNQVVIDGDSKGTVVTLNSISSKLSGFKIINSGESHTDSDAAMDVSGSQNVVENIKIENTFFGIKSKNCKKCTFLNNQIESYKEKDVSERGDGFFVWNSPDNLFIGNTISYVRDFSINNSPNNIILENSITYSRTGLFLVFALGAEIKSNNIQNNSTGIAALYSKGVVINNNRIAHALTGNASCISTKDSVGVKIIENQLIHCGVGYLSDAPMGEDVLVLSKNLFAHNFLAVRIYGQKGSHHFTENVFFQNLVNMFLPLDGHYKYIVWDKNYWDNYIGFGQEPYLDVVYADRIWMEIPKAKFFSNSPFFELIDFLEKLAPFSSPTIQAEDKFPQTKQSEVFQRYKNVIYK